MQAILSGIAVVVSLLGLAYANFHPRSLTRRDRWRALGAPPVHAVALGGVVAVVALVAATISSHRPWAEGMQLGWGLLLGGLLALYALYEATGGPERGDWAPQAVGVLAAAALGPAVVLLLFPGYPNEALMGVALGAAGISALFVAVLRPWSPPNGDPLPVHTAALEVFALATVACAAASRLAVSHFPHVQAGGGYWALPPLLLATEALAIIMLAGNWRPRVRKWLLLAAGLAGGAVGVVLLAVLRAKHLLPDLSWAVGLGGLVALSFALAALLWEDPAEGEPEARPVGLAFGAVLLALVVATAAFRVQHGFGQMLAILTALPLLGVAYLGSRRPRPAPGATLAWGAFTVLLLLALYRLFLELVRHTAPLDFQEHYDLIGVVLGVMTLFGLLAVLDRARQSAGERRPRPLADLGRAVVWGIALALAPLVLMTAWGPRTCGAYLAGLVIAAILWTLLVAWTGGEERGRLLVGTPGVYLVAATLGATQLGPLVQNWEPTRTIKLLVVGVVLAGVLLWLLAAARAERRPGEAEGGESYAPES
ncbi:MAG TPA: hypothetical protein VGM19_09215 [Armatimonadota bacterium]|jgi:hypothetical protein